jgi:hypothetical protein
MLREIKMEARTRWLLGYILQYVILVLAFALCIIVAYRAGGVRAAKKYEDWKERYVTEFLELEAAKAAGAPIDPYQAQLDDEAQELARVLYGVRQNSTDDLRTYCWCVLNRVDSPDFPDTLADVIGQPKQWMRYDPDAPVLDDLFKIARSELDAWHTGTTRPCGVEFVFMNWSPTEITLRDNWEDGSRTHYWRAK